MRIESGTTDKYIYFVAVDASDFSTRETGLTPASFTVYRSRNGGAATVMTTPTINETDATNMPGVYELLLDEDMAMASDNDTEEMVFHITATGMAPVTRTIELFRNNVTSRYLGTVTGSPTTTQFRVTGGSSTDDFYNGAIVGFRDGSLKGITRRVTDYVGSTEEITVSPALPQAPSTSDVVVLLSVSPAATAEEVNAEVLDVLNTDTFAEPGQGVPGSTISLAQKIGYLYKAWRNKSTQTSTTYSLFNKDDTTVDHKATVSDDGTTATKGETTTGP